MDRELIERIAILALADQKDALLILAKAIIGGKGVDRLATEMGAYNIPRSYILDILAKIRKMDRDTQLKLAHVIARVINEVQPIMRKGLRGAKCLICRRGTGSRGIMHVKTKHSDVLEKVTNMIMEWVEKGEGDSVILSFI